jgi:lipopolysaccharide/colanic/teichoic acid biosynthesis glycosyltransferase
MATHLTGRISLTRTDLWSYLQEATPQTPLLRMYSQFKAIIEPLFAVVLGVVFAPVMLALAVVIKMSSPGPIFYRQMRTGYLGRNFLLYKFRSMRADAEANGPQWASSNDDRVTPVGKFMRKTRLDELPQLWNVFKGEMSFFGPRPERPEIYQRLKKEIPLFSMRTIVRPGITGWAQVCAGYAATIEQSFDKLEYDLFYIAHMSLRLDLIVLVKTVQVALFGSEAEKRNSSIAPEPVSGGTIPGTGAG